MTEDPQSSQPTQPESPPLVATVVTPKPRWPASRIILLVLLAITLGLWAFDFFAGNRSEKHAFELLNAKLSTDDIEKAEKGKGVIGKQVEVIYPDDVHKLLGCSPDATETDPAQLRQYNLEDKEGKNPKGVGPLAPPAMVEVYSYRGAFRSYVLRVAYSKSAVAKTGSAYYMTGLKQTKE